MRRDMRRRTGLGVAAFIAVMAIVVSTGAADPPGTTSFSIGFSLNVAEIHIDSFASHTTLSPVLSDPFRFSSDPDNTYDGYNQIELWSTFDSWQLDLSAENGGLMLRSGDNVPTTNRLNINLYSDGDHSGDPLATSLWPDTGDAVCNMVMMEENDVNNHYNYFIKYDILTSPNDPLGDYAGSVTWTLSAPLQGQT